MGLDMFIIKFPRIGNYTYSDMYAADSYIRLCEYRKKHPDYKGRMKDWCGFNKPDYKLIRARKKRGKEFIEEVAYWRKANEIHNWFVENVQDGEDDCQIHRELMASDLEELLVLCEEVKADHSKAEELLPRVSGFFFGDQEYDAWYFEDLDSTIDQLSKLLKETDFDNEQLYYDSSW